jgi:2-polyprenyl-6-hydroxyphenyl methylase/3-demethylubiquinone-9 3-methyltransferase
MKRVYLASNWTDLWKECYAYDLLEVYEDYGNYKGYAYAYKNRRNNTLELVSSIAKPGGKILDVAAAQGNFSLKLAELGYDVTWNDIRADLAEYVEMKREKGMISYKPGNVFELQFDSLFDVIIATEIIEHVAHPDEFLNGLAKFLKPGGHIIITTPLGNYFKNRLPKFSEFSNPEVFEKKQFGPNSADHIFLLHLDEIPALAKKSNLQIVALKYYTNPLTNGHMQLNRFLSVLPERLIFLIESFTQKLPQSIGRRIHNNFAVLFKKERSNPD